MGPIRIIGQSRPLGKSRPILRVARSADRSSPADSAGDSPERKASHSGARSSAATACTREIRPEEHQGDYADYLCRGRAGGLLGKTRVLALRRNLNLYPTREWLDGGVSVDPPPQALPNVRA